MRTPWILAVVAAGVLAAGRAAGQDDEESGQPKAELEIKQAQRLLGELKEDIGNLRAEAFSFDPEERYVDAQVYFDMKHYGESALLFTSLVEDPRFKADTKYWDAVRQLGIALYNQGNLQSAHRQFERLLQVPAQAEVALTYLVEIAARLHRDEELRQLADRIPAGTGSPGLLYAKGKALYFVGDYARALDVFKAVPATAPDGLKARYLAGACLVATGQLDAARGVFQNLVAEKARDEDQKQIVDLAYMALGRLAYEQGDFSAAADFYQHLSQTSPLFERAMYEVVHVYLKWANAVEDPEERYRRYLKAEEILDILVNLTKDPALSRDARVLRGRIAMFLRKYEKAKESYQAVIDLYSFTSSEITDLAQDPRSIDRFFAALVRGGAEDGGGGVFVSQDVIQWMRTQPDLGRVVDVLTEVAEQRRVLEEARAIWQQLSYGLSQQSARELFPGFSDAWLKSLEIENRLLDADGIYLDLQRAALAGRLAGKDKANAEELYRKRAALEKRLATAPRTVGAYRARSKTVTVRLHQIAKDIDEDILHIRKIQEQLVAMQKLLKEVKYKGSTMLQVKDEDQLLKELEAEAAALDALLQEAEAMRAQVEQEMLISEVADPMGQSERDVKTELWQAHREEAAFYAGKGTGLDAAGTRLFETASARRREIYTMLESVADLQEQIDQKAARQIAVYQKVLDEEKLALDARERELNATEQDAIVFARGVGSVLFYKAKESLVKAVIEAELGLVDLAWEQEEEQRREVQQVVLEKTELINRLNAELNEIQPPGGGEEQ